MSGYTIAQVVMGMLAALALLSVGVMIWQAAVTGPELTPVQRQFSDLADGTFKVALGALLGFLGGFGLTRRNGR